MAETEVRSPISRRGSAAGSGQPLSPGAKSNPSRGDGRRDAGLSGASQIKTHQEPEPARPPRAGEPEPAQATVVGPED